MSASPLLPPEVFGESIVPATLPAAPPAPGAPIGDLHRQWRAADSAGGRRSLPPAPPVLSRARVRHMRRGGPKVLLWAVVCYAAAQAGLVLVLDHWHPTLTESWYSHKWEQLRSLVARDPDRPLLLMLGSSRTDDAFEAALLDGLPGPGGKPWVAYNFGVPMVGPLRDGLYLKELLAAGIRPRLLVVEFLPVFFNESHKGFISEENWAFPQLMTLPQLRHLWPYFEHPHHMGRCWLEGRLATWYAVRFNLCQEVRKTVLQATGNPVCEASGWKYWKHDSWGFRLPRSHTFGEFVRAWFGTRNTFQPTLQTLRVAPGPVAAVRELLDRCRREKIPVVLVQMPESGEFRTWYCPEGRQQMRRLFEELGREYATAALDASDWVADSDFRDGHHVLGAGARAFTTRLIEELRPILARLGEGAPEQPAVAAATGSP